jgi:hypothetical protein
MDVVLDQRLRRQVARRVRDDGDLPSHGTPALLFVHVLHPRALHDDAQIGDRPLHPLGCIGVYVDLRHDLGPRHDQGVPHPADGRGDPLAAR